MHGMVLGVAGYGLLLSSCVALIFLLRMGCAKDILKSPLHVLSTSDTLISMITSIILLMNQSVPLTSLEQDSEISRDEVIVNRALLDDNDRENDDQSQTCMRFYHEYNGSWPESQAASGTITNCTFQHVLMHYAMFLIPFTNAFVSLLIYSLQCSRTLSCVNERYSGLTKVSENMKKDLKPGNSDEGTDQDLNFRRRGSGGAKEDLNIISKDPGVDQLRQETILIIPNVKSVLSSSNNIQKFAGVGLITQWLVPVLVTVILYFSQTQDMSKPRESNEMECIFRINFPLESCDKVELAEIEYTSNPSENYSESTIVVEDLDTLRISYPDSEAIDKVISNVRSVVQSALNNTCNNSIELKYYNNSRPWNITKYITVDNITGQMTTDKAGMLDKLADIQQALNNKNMGLIKTNDCTNENGKDTVDADQENANENEELRIFQNMLKSSEFEEIGMLRPLRPETKPQDLFQQGVTTTTQIKTYQDIQMTHVNDTSYEIPGQTQTKEAEHKTTDETKSETITGDSNSQIYADIIKRIRDTVVQAKVKGHVGNLQGNYEAKNDKVRNIESEVPPLRSGSRKIRKDKKISFAEYEDEIFKRTVLHMDERCFLSTKFLKIHLLILLFFIYFIPVLVSGILQTRAVYMCENVFERIEAVDRSDVQSSRTLDQNKVTIDKNPPSKSGWFSGGFDNAAKADPPNPQDMDHPNISAPLQRIRSGTDSENNYEVKKIACKNCLQETRSVQTLFRILTRSLMLSVLMWTPVFLEILSKVFLCASTSPWLVNVLYLLGASFGIVKNFLNVTIARINKNINEQIHGKENSVHPGV